MSYKNWLNIDISDFNKMTRKELAKATGELRKEANRRISELQSRGYTSTALSFIEKSGGKISTKDKTINQLRHEFMRASGFLKSEGSSIKGVNRIRYKTAAMLAVEDVDVAPGSIDRFFRVYDKLKEVDPIVSSVSFRYRYMQEIAKMTENTELSVDEIVSDITSRVEEIYNDRTDEYNDTGVSDYFS